jgi:hypothetical protein
MSNTTGCGLGPSGLGTVAVSDAAIAGALFSRFMLLEEQEKARRKKDE